MAKNRHPLHGALEAPKCHALLLKAATIMIWTIGSDRDCISTERLSPCAIKGFHIFLQGHRHPSGDISMCRRRVPPTGEECSAESYL